MKLLSARKTLSLLRRSLDVYKRQVMKRASIRVQEPTPELIEKIRRARVAISQQKPRYLKCPYCQHNAIAVYEDTRGHVESKCKKCGRITVFDVLNMRRLRPRTK